MPDFDAIIIGTGQAGPSLAFRLAGAGMRVAVVERALVGGTCVNTGCTPTKTLVASAYTARVARRAAEYGVMIGGGIGIDMPRVKARKDAIVAASRNGLTSALENAANITLYRGHAGSRRRKQWKSILRDALRWSAPQDEVRYFNGLPHPEEARRAVSKGADRGKPLFSHPENRSEWTKRST
jgi:pyruvate/2-oxoglutarate dehydrogenase complex dihydrolipoamide dehydrogenase (E3) component